MIKEEYCEDAISRKEVSDWLKNKRTYNRQEAEDIDNFYHFINNLPSVTPIRLKGHWIKDGDDFKCDKCGHVEYRNGYNFCSSCGADMREVK